MELSVTNIEKVILECLFKEGENTTPHVIGIGVQAKMGFHPERLKANEENILSMLLQLPDAFMASRGGGYTFLNACETKDGEQWTGMHTEVDKLVILGAAIGRVVFTMPREMWSALPGRMPYFTVKDVV